MDLFSMNEHYRKELARARVLEKIIEAIGSG